MSRSKKVFIGIALLFFAFLVWLIFDISRKTTFPGGKSKAKPASGEVAKDTVKNHSTGKSTTQQP